MKTTRIIRLVELPKNLFKAVKASNKESARVWNFCKDKLQESIKNREEWPTKDTLHNSISGTKQFQLHSQSVQQVCRAFIDCLSTTKKLRREHPELKFRYPHKDKLFYSTIWTSQAAKVKAGILSLPMGRDRNPLVFRVDLQDGGYPCRIVWNDGFELHVCQELPAATQVGSSDTVAAIDLGEIHQIACVASNGNALLISGRGIRTVKHLNNKMLGKIQRIKVNCKNGSKRFGRITRSRNRQSERNNRRVRNLRHNGTRKVVDFLVANQVGKLFVGNPDGVRKKDSGRHHNQRMCLWEYGKDIQYIKEKTGRVGIEFLKGSERGTSSTCPVCGFKRRQKGRRWVCTNCGFRGHRDLVGATNMHLLAFGVPMICPNKATYLRPGPVKSIGLGSNSRADTLQSSLVSERNERSVIERWRPVRDRTTFFRSTRNTSPSGDCECHTIFRGHQPSYIV